MLKGKYQNEFLTPFNKNSMFHDKHRYPGTRILRVSRSAGRPPAALIVLLIALTSAASDQALAQKLTVLHSFLSEDYGAAYPAAGLVAVGQTLFGTTTFSDGGPYSSVFRVNTDGMGYASIFGFNTPQDSGNPAAELIESDGTLYGASTQFGISGYGTVFKVNTNGTGYQVLHDFTALPLSHTPATNNDGVWPMGKLVISGTTLFGTASSGGSGGSGTVFRVNTDGSGFSVIHAFSATGPSFSTNVDGASPTDLILLGNTLYGTTLMGGSGASGAIFKINTDGTGLTVLHQFAPSTNYPDAPPDGPEGSGPGKLILSGSTLYGTTFGGTSGGNGTIFRLNTDGTGFKTLHSFSGPATRIFNGSNTVTNRDGAVPNGLALAGNILYGPAVGGGSSGSGTVFSLHTDGSGFRTLYNFSGTLTDSRGYPTNSDGAGPNGVLLIGSILYGTTQFGGRGGGTVFAISLPPELSLTSSGSNFILSWPTNFTGYMPQTTTDFSSPVWGTNLPAPVIVNGQYTVTDSIPGTQRFFRLSR